jgi:Ca2+-binding RTX toxin-like protein
MVRSVRRTAGRALVALASGLLVLLFLVPAAGAVVTCGFAAGTVTVTFGAAGESATIARSGDAIVVNGAGCGGATVTNTDLISVDGFTGGTQAVTVDLSGGLFEPGATGEGGGDPTDDIEIDIVDLGGDPGDSLAITGSAGADSIIIADGGLPPDGSADFNDPDGDFDDLTWVGVSTLTVNSGAGDDYVDASGYTFSSVTIDGGDGDDWLVGTAGNDVLAGGNGSDFIDYWFAGSGVTVNLQGNQTATGGGGTDTISGFENIVGTDFADVLSGSQDDNWIAPGDGDDTASGGNQGNDTVDYFTASGGVTVDLNVAINVTGGAGTDSLSGFINVYGTTLDDVLTGTAGDNVLGEGGGGNDTLAGGAGFDIADYFGAAGPIAVDLDATPQSITGSGVDVVSGLEGVWGTDADDTFDGSTVDEEFDGAGGVDTVTFADAAAGVVVDLTGGFSEGEGSDGLFGIENATGSGFDDWIEGTYGATAAEADNVLDGGLGTDTVSYSQAGAGVVVMVNGAAQNTVGGGTDSLANFENLAGSAFNDSLAGDAGNNVLTGGAGDDTLDGNAGTDTTDHSGAPAAVSVDLLAGTATGGDGTDSLSEIENVTGSAFDDTFAGDAGNNVIDGGDGVDMLSYQFSGSAMIVDLKTGIATGQGVDTLSGVEQVKGSNFDDTLLGDGADNKLQGVQGNDEIAGKGGNDVLGGSGGNDNIRGGSGDDNLKGGPGIDRLAGGKGTDVCSGGPGKDIITKSCE